MRHRSHGTINEQRPQEAERERIRTREGDMGTSTSRFSAQEPKQARS